MTSQKPPLQIPTFREGIFVLLCKSNRIQPFRILTIWRTGDEGHLTCNQKMETSDWKESKRSPGSLSFSHDTNFDLCFNLLSTEILSGGEADAPVISPAPISLAVMQLGTGPGASCTCSCHWACGSPLQYQVYIHNRSSETGIQGTVRQSNGSASVCGVLPLPITEWLTFPRVY